MNEHEITILNNNFKLYITGQTYNGIALTTSIVGGGLNAVISRGIYRPYRLVTGENMLYFSVEGLSASSGTSPATMTVSGITFKNVANYNQAVAAYAYGQPFSSADVRPNTNTILLYWSGGLFPIKVALQGDVELDSWPTWADVII